MKEELWQATAGYRQKILRQKVMKFAPLVGDGSSARWNPLAEINFRTAEKISDVAMIVGIMVKPDGEKSGGGLGKGSNSESFTGRELMTADEVSHMSSERELVFVAGHRPIYGKKLRYYLQPFFTERLKKYQEIYVREHDFQKFCKKFPNGSDEVCQKCIEKYKIPKGFPAMVCPTYPLYSDSVTKVLSYEDLFAVNAAEKFERDEKARAVKLEKEFAERKSAKEKSKKVKLSKEKILEEQKSDEKFESVAENREVAKVDGKNQSQSEFAEVVGTDGENLGGQIGNRRRKFGRTNWSE